MPDDSSAAAIVAAAEESRKSLFDLELGIEKEVDALRFRAFRENRDLTAEELDRRTKLRACQAEIRDAHTELAHVTLVRLDSSDEVRSLNARIGEVNRGLADDLQALKDLEELAGKLAEVTDKLAQVVRKIAERVV
jgi:seryl-tRNA synthetase